ncbi:MAG: hypothetical protein N3H84_03615 [Candidatus Caldarchaeum sp.]|nr:hypothetical protein [Candidatus Caldarchaeum sp.]MCX8201173.1 hypothetical protein [Candidatus Caldarchaeum sp.]MDW8435432.1 hypothetical protein [Candidatus Caldarchaeum sp.]
MAEKTRPVVGSKIAEIKQALKDFFFGALLLSLYQNVVRFKRKYDDIFFSLVMGEFLGIPLLGNYFTIRLIPYFLPELEAAKKRLLRDVDILELLKEGPSVH